MAGISNKAAAALDNKFEFNGQEMQDDFEIDWYQYKWRNYDSKICRFFSVDPLTDKYETLTPYQFSSNNPVSMRELEGLEGVKFQEVDEDGKLIRHVIQETVYVVVVDEADKKSMTRRELKNRVKSTYSSDDVKTIKSILNTQFNGSEGTGATNNKGETVYYDFDVRELRIASNDASTELSIARRAARELATESGDFDYNDAMTDERVNKKAPANILYGGGYAGGLAEGANNNIQTRMSTGKEFDFDSHLHEMLHQLLTRPKYDSEHALGGGLANPVERINSANVNATLQDAYNAKVSVKVIKTFKKQ